jgi:hypothetical protein
MTTATGTLAQVAAAYKAPETVVAAIQYAAQRTGVDFGYLLTKAQTESSFNTNAKAGSSSATGLYQFTDKTWLQMVHDHGSDCGLDKYADAINDDCTVDSSATRKQILSLRKDPTISAYMAAEYTKSNAAQLEANTDAKVGKTELYLAHFLGPGGASKFLNAYESNPNAKAANILPAEADANPNVFYSSSGAALSLKQIYNHFASKFNEGSPVVDIAAAQTLPMSPALAANTLNQSLPANNASMNSLAQIGNINISLSQATCNSLMDIANSNSQSAQVTGISTAALNGIQQQSSQQNLAFLTQMALTQMASDNVIPGVTQAKTQSVL